MTRSPAAGRGKPLGEATDIDRTANPAFFVERGAAEAGCAVRTIPKTATADESDATRQCLRASTDDIAVSIGYTIANLDSRLGGLPPPEEASRLWMWERKSVPRASRSA